MRGKSLFLALALLTMASLVSGEERPPETVAHVDLKRYAGTWYEIARFPFKQQNGCYNTTATYSLNDDGTIKVVNRCRKGGFEAPESTAFASAKVVDNVSNAKLKVKFFVLAPWADYWIVRLGAGYEYAVVSQPDRKYLWILSRTPHLSPALYDEIVKSLEADNYKVQLLEKTPQSMEGFNESPANALVLVAPYLRSLVIIFTMMTLLWGLSLLLKDASIIDRFWGMGFVLVSVQQLLQNQFLTFRAGLVFLLVMVWGLRLSLHIHFRNRRKPEDARYQAMRTARGEGYWWKSYFSVFVLQGVLMWIISAPLAIVHLFPQPDVPTILDFVGILLWATGFVFEAVADFQLAKFKKEPANHKKVCRVGLWNLSRHPNYFGESLIWWGYFLIALNVDYGWATLFSPILMTFLLLKVSGVALLEKQLSATKPGYQSYLEEVPAFFPFGRVRARKG